MTYPNKPFKLPLTKIERINSALQRPSVSWKVPSPVNSGSLSSQDRGSKIHIQDNPYFEGSPIIKHLNSFRAQRQASEPSIDSSFIRQATSPSKKIPTLLNLGSKVPELKSLRTLRDTSTDSIDSPAAVNSSLPLISPRTRFERAVSSQKARNEPTFSTQPNYSIDTSAEQSTSDIPAPLFNHNEPKKSGRPVPRATLKLLKSLQAMKTLAFEKDESRVRLQKAEKLFPQLQIPPMPDESYGVRLIAKMLAKETDRVTEIAESLMSTMNFTVRVQLEQNEDSGMILYPIEDRVTLVSFYKTFLPMIYHFPYSFLVKIKLSMITLCRQVQLFKSSHVGVLDQKLLNGLFVLSKLTTPEGIRRHWYRIVIYHFVKRNPSFYDEWKKQINQEQQGVTDKRTAFGELVRLFVKMMTMKNIEHEPKDVCMKIEMINQKLQEFDPEGFTREWWCLKESILQKDHA